MKVGFAERQIHESESAAVIQFEGGRAFHLPRHGNGDYTACLEAARTGLKDHSPLAVTVAKPDRIVTITAADSDCVWNVMERDAERLRVGFRQHDGICYLRKDNPDFLRVKQVLEQSAKNRALVWLSLDMDRLLVVDAMPMEKRAKK